MIFGHPNVPTPISGLAPTKSALPFPGTNVSPHLDWPFHHSVSLLRRSLWFHRFGIHPFIHQYFVFPMESHIFLGFSFRSTLLTWHPPFLQKTLSMRARTRANQPQPLIWTPLIQALQYHSPVTTRNHRTLTPRSPLSQCMNLTAGCLPSYPFRLLNPQVFLPWDSVLRPCNPPLRFRT